MNQQNAESKLEQAATHELKIWPEYFDDVESGRKTFEVRKMDRLFGTGDTLWLREWSPIKGYSGRETRKKITYVMPGGQWGLTEGNCILGIQSLTTPAGNEVEEILKKYKTFVSNIEWHIKTNEPKGDDLKQCELRLDCYNEIVTDLERTPSKPHQEQAADKCRCRDEIKTGHTSVMCCNVCGRPDEGFWTGQTQEPVKCNGNCGMNYCDEYGCIENKPEGDVSHLLTPPPAPVGIDRKSFLDVLVENYQAQIAGFYNDDKTDAERAKRNAVIEEYQDLIAIFKRLNDIK